MTEFAPPTDWTLDHLVFAARNLSEGQAWLEERFGVPLEPGGQHPQFGTHNRLLGLSLPSASSSYLEVIAIDPHATPTISPRWFELDAPQMQRRLAERPQLIHWVAAVPSLSSHPLALPLERGPNRWQLTVAPDGSLPSGGLQPSLIAWDTPSPAQSLPPSGVTLLALDLCGPNPEVLRPWTGERQGVRISVCQAAHPRLRATFSTPRGEITLD